MAKISENKLHVIAWTSSFLFHFTLLLFFGAYVILHPPRFTVKSGRTSTAIKLTLVAEPKALEPPPPTVAPIPPIPPPLLPQPPPLHFPMEIATPKTEPTILATLGAKLPPTRTTPEKASRKTASPGATQAEPDDLHNDPPIYPEESLAAGEQGVVILRVEVTADGLPVSVGILRSSGYFRLDQAARRAVQHWKFHPAHAGGAPIRSEVDTPVHFTLQ